MIVYMAIRMRTGIFKPIWCVFLLTVFLGGCESKVAVKNTGRSNVRPEKSVSVSVLGDKMDGVEKMERCRRGLESLKKINTAVYNKRKAEFDKLMSGASLYNGVRNDVEDYTQGAVDALYRFRADKLCADISNDVLNVLSRE